MKSIQEFKSKIKFLLTDIDDTLTNHGLLQKNAFDSVWKLHESGVHVIPVTGRPAGWCELIARQWPVAAVVGENGAFYFRYTQKKMLRHFCADEKSITENRKKLEKIKTEILNSVPGCAVASDQFCRLMDLAIDFCEDVAPLSEKDVDRIKAIFEKHGAHAKVSSIHVNGWFGEYNKLSESLHLLKSEFQLSDANIKEQCAFVGDSPNDEPMWEFFPNSLAVSNIKTQLHRLQTKPNFVSDQDGGNGFSQIAEKIIRNNLT